MIDQSIRDDYERQLNSIFKLRHLSETKERSGTFVVDDLDYSATDVEPESDRPLEDLVRLPYSAMSNVEIEKIIDYKANARAYVIFLDMVKIEDPSELETFKQIIDGSDLGYPSTASYTEV